MDNNLLYSYINGDSHVEIYDDGTRTVSFPEEEPNLEYPLNIDIRVSNKCALGYNPKTKKSFCEYCHESARTDGIFCDFEKLQEKLVGLPEGIELAIGSNSIPKEFIWFLEWCQSKNFICNLTINQMHIKRDKDNIRYLIKSNIIKGLGISLRDPNIIDSLPEDILNYSNTVIHVIAGLDDLDLIESQVKSGKIKKILILGYKIFGSGISYYKNNKESIDKKIYYWRTNFIRLHRAGALMSFDNLALEQLNVRRMLSSEQWKEFYQSEYSMYINAPEGKFSESSRSDKTVSWDSQDIKSYFKSVIYDDRRSAKIDSRTDERNQ